MFQLHFLSCKTSNMLRSIHLQKIFLIKKQFQIVREIQITVITQEIGIMILILKFTVSAIQRKISLRTVSKIKQIIFELNKVKLIISNPFQIEQGKLKTQNQ